LYKKKVEYFAYGVEDFALYLSPKIVPTRRVLLLRYKNRYETLVQSLVLAGVNVTSAYPLTWMKKEWSPQEERIAKEVDGSVLFRF
jgi:uroporphyrinogen-III synthase